MNEQQQQNKQNSFFGKMLNKSKSALDKVKKVVKAIIATIKAIITHWKILLVLVLIVTATTLFVSFLEVIIEFDEEEVNDAKQGAILMTYSGKVVVKDTTGAAGSSGTTGTGNVAGEGGSGNTSDSNEGGANNTGSQVILKANEAKNGYEISYNNSTEYLNNVKENLELISVDTSEFNDTELGIVGALMDNGADLQYYNAERLKCFDEFIKAEACTQNLDLRKNSEKFGGKEETVENYVPKKMEDIAENEITGIILVQRTNTNGDSKTILEYKEKASFDALIEANNKDAINYFTVNDEGNLVIAKWDHIKVVVNEEDYPENLDESEKAKNKDEDIITTEEIPYNQYISKYKMPFEFLIQLLEVTKEPEFCMDLVEEVLNSKIVINIQEEETVTVTDETRDYTVHNKDEKYIDYKINAATQQIVAENNYLLKYAKDDEQDENGENNCTNYSNKLTTVNVHTEYTSHSYVFEIIEADVWLAHYKKEYADSIEEKQPTAISDPEPEKTEYKQIESEIAYPITDENTIKDDKDVKTFIDTTETNYEPKIVVPSVTVSDETFVDNDGKKFKTINVTGGHLVGRSRYCYEILDEDGNGTDEYNVPLMILVNSEKVSSTNETKEIPEISYNFTRKTSKNILTGKITSYNYEITTDIDPLVECSVSSLNIKEFEKIVLDNYIETKVTKYISNPNLPTIHIYATESGSPGKGHGAEGVVYEKFLKAYDRSSGARKHLSSFDSWLFDLMENRESTVELIDTVKYLLYMYDGIDRGVTELEGFGDLFNPGEFVSASSGGNISLTTPILSKEDFIKALQEYNGGTNYDNNFKSRAEEIYDLGIKYGVNPELIVTMAKKESGFKPAGGQNYWGLDTPNGSAAAYFGTFESGVKRLSEIFKTYMPGAKYANLITQRKNERSAANCNANGYGDPGTLKGMLSVYSDLCGSDTKHREGNWGSGGNIYLREIYGAEFAQKCGNIHKIGVDDYTLQEKSDYTAWLYENQLTYWTDIFGKYGSISSGGDFLAAAQEVWEIVSKTGSGYTYGGSSVPCTRKTIDCSSYVSWVLLEYGYTGFKGPQTTTYGFYNTNWNKKYGWQEIYLNKGENATSKVQPGDIYVRREADSGHVCIIAEIKDGKVYAYDCGGTNNWKDKNGGLYDVTWFMDDNRPGKIIRVTPPQS